MTTPETTSAPTDKHCPECRQELEPGTALLVSGMLAGAAYHCMRCKMLYTSDLQPLARMVG